LPSDFDIPNASRTPAARVAGMELLSPTKTIRGGQSLILNWPMREDRTLFVNLLIDPQVLVETARFSEDFEAATMFDDVPNRELFRFESRHHSSDAATPISPLSSGTFPGTESFYALARSGPYPVFSLILVSNAAIQRHWRTQMQPAVIAGFLLSGLAFLLLRRYLPKDDAAGDLRAGIEADEIVLDYQPIMDASTRRIIGAEALARWRHPRRGLVMPDEFIPLAESTGLISPLTERVLERVRRKRFIV
jgi:sensor c-di-GMP phosphodiesterase-like protein